MIAWVPLSVAAVDGTNEAAFTLPIPTLTLEPAHSQVLVDRFFEEVSTTDSILFDRFTGPSARVGWLRREAPLGYASIDHMNKRAASMFTSIGMDSLRTAALDVLPLDQWEDHFDGFFTKLILGSLGNPEEEHLRITSIAYSDVRYSWESANRGAGLQWGIRPWSTTPYVYVLARAGHWNGQPLITFDGRAAYTLFGTARLEGRLTVPLPGRFRLAGGVSVEPSRIGSNDPDNMHTAVTLERVIRLRESSSPEALFYVGFRSGANWSQGVARHENLIVAGFSKRW